MAPHPPLQLRPGADSAALRRAMIDALDCCSPHWDYLQQLMKCCGVDGPDDWPRQGYSVPESCSEGESEEESSANTTAGAIATEGCLVSAAALVAGCASLLIGSALVIMVFLIGTLVMVAALWALEVRSKSEQKETAQNSSLSSPHTLSQQSYASPSPSFYTQPIERFFSSSSSTSTTEEEVKASTPSHHSTPLSHHS